MENRLARMIGHIIHGPALSKQMTTAIATENGNAMKASRVDKVVKAMQEQNALWVLQKPDGTFPLFVGDRLNGRASETMTSGIQAE